MADGMAAPPPQPTVTAVGVATGSGSPVVPPSTGNAGLDVTSLMTALGLVQQPQPANANNLPGTVAVTPWFQNVPTWVWYAGAAAVAYWALYR